MKLLRCRQCGDIFNLTINRIKTCSCTLSYGQYDEDGLHAWYAGPCDMLGFANRSVVEADLLNTNSPPAEQELGYQFDAFFIPESASTVRRIDHKKYVQVINYLDLMAKSTRHKLKKELDT